MHSCPHRLHFIFSACSRALLCVESHLASPQIRDRCPVLSCMHRSCLPEHAHPQRVVGGDRAEDVQVADEGPEEVDAVYRNVPYGRRPHHRRVVRRVQAQEEAVAAVMVYVIVALLLLPLQALQDP